MTKLLDYFLDRVTMYRLVLYVLVGLIGVAAILAYVHLLSFSPLALLLSTAFLVVMCLAANSLLAAIFKVPPNVESVYITALILALILDPAKSLADLPFLGWAAVLAMASKYVLSLFNKHLLILPPSPSSSPLLRLGTAELVGWYGKHAACRADRRLPARAQAARGKNSGHLY